MRKIVGKSIPNKTHLENRVKAGITDIEIQLYGKDIDVGEVLNTIYSVEGLKINSVHTPLGVEGEVNLEHLEIPYKKDLIQKTCAIANDIGQSYQQVIPVVIHSEVDMNDIDTYKQSWKVILKEIKLLLYYYPFVCFCIENIIPMVGNDIPRTVHSFKFENVELVKYLRKELSSNRFYTTLDLCHAISSIRMLEEWKRNSLKVEVPSLEDYFRENAEYCRICHFSDVINWGYGKDEHGVYYQKQEDLERNVDLFDQYLSFADMVLEIQEPDYEKFPNLLKMSGQIRNYDKNR